MILKKILTEEVIEIIKASIIHELDMLDHTDMTLKLNDNSIGVWIKDDTIKEVADRCIDYIKTELCEQDY